MERNDLSAEVLLLARAISRCEEGEIVLLERLCAAAEETAASRLRGGVRPEDCAGAFVCAAAWLAASGLELSRGGEDISSLRAGDLSVTAKTAPERAARAEQLREQAERMLAPYSDDSGFFFCGVTG